jgi:hypothetical protein
MNANQRRFTPVWLASAVLSFIGACREWWWSWRELNPRAAQHSCAFRRIRANPVRTLQHRRRCAGAAWVGLPAVLAGCATTPAWFEEPHLVVPIRWVRLQGAAQSEVREGACVLYLPDTTTARQVDRVAAEPLVHACLAKGGLRPGAGDFDLHWHLVDGVLESSRRHTELEPRGLALKPAAILKPSGRWNGLADGFARREGDICRVVTHGTHRLGHELRHCYDGAWHP